MKTGANTLQKLNTIDYLVKNYNKYIKLSNFHLLSVDINGIKETLSDNKSSFNTNCQNIFVSFLEKIFGDSLLVKRSKNEFIIITYYSNQMIASKLEKLYQEISNCCKKKKTPVKFKFNVGIKKCDLDLKSTLFKADITLDYAKKNGNMFDYYDEMILEESRNLNNTCEELEKFICYSSLSHVIQGIYDIECQKKIMNEIVVKNCFSDYEDNKDNWFLNCSSFLKNFDFNNITKIVENVIPTLNNKEQYLLTVHLETVNNCGQYLVSYLQDAMKKNHLSPKQICLSLKINDNIRLNHHIIDVLSKIKNIGFSICIENFNLYFNTYLLSLIAVVDVDYIKIDKILLIKSMNEKKTNVLLKSIIKMLLGLKVKPIFINIDNKGELEYIKKLSSNCLIKGSITKDEKEIKNTEFI
ncbi:MAG: EAL domain-containing protein [Bacilli bacterium]|nr:EAL domain-containing protein [Bacilli bacterium]